MSRHYTKACLPVLILGIICMNTMVLAQDMTGSAEDNALESGSIPTQYLSISYHGRTQDTDQNTREPLQAESRDILFFTQDIAAAIPAADGDGLFGLGEKISQVSRTLLKYIFVDETDLEESVSPFHMKSMMMGQKAPEKPFDLNLSVNVGTDQARVVTVKAVKLSSYWLSTHLDAVYNTLQDDIEVYVSNTKVNRLLPKDMKLEFQYDAGASSSAFLLTMQF